MPPRKYSKEFVFHREEPDLSDDLTTPADAEALFAMPKISVTGHSIEDIAISGSVSTALYLEACTLERVNLAGSRFASILWKDVRLVNCDLANLETESLTLIRVEFLDCRMTGLRAGKANLEHVLFSGGDQRYAQFCFSCFRSTECNGCNFSEADFYGTDLTGTRFRSCNLQRAEMDKVKLLNADLRGSQVEGLKLNAEDIRGAIVDPAQAMLFAPLLGIQIK
jgi:uncharacterized protein YjbI with pentapeptide repeats